MGITQSQDGEAATNISDTSEAETIEWDEVTVRDIIKFGGIDYVVTNVYTAEIQPETTKIQAESENGHIWLTVDADGDVHIFDSPSAWRPNDD